MKKGTTETRISNGLCPRCGKPAVNGKRRCERCLSKDRNRCRERALSLVSEGRCAKCGIPVESNKRKCIECINNGRQSQIRYAAKCAQQGKCYRCKHSALDGNVLCRSCLLKNLSLNATGTRDNADALDSLLNKQNFTCPYTGIKIDVGNNASIDHIIPRSKGGSDTIDNLQWVHFGINLLKADMDQNVFVNYFDIFLQAAFNFRFEKKPSDYRIHTREITEEKCQI